MMDPAFIKEYLFPDLDPKAPGGQELIALEIVAALKRRGVTKLYMPYQVGAFPRFAKSCGIDLVSVLDAEATYLGTPTIVNNKKLFANSAEGEWTVSKERATMRRICKAAAEQPNMRVIITGLGSGDILPLDRKADMNQAGWTPPICYCTKMFDSFTDWLFITVKEKDHGTD